MQLSVILNNEHFLPLFLLDFDWFQVGLGSDFDLLLVYVDFADFAIGAQVQIRHLQLRVFLHGRGTDCRLVEVQKIVNLTLIFGFFFLSLVSAALDALHLEFGVYRSIRAIFLGFSLPQNKHVMVAGVNSKMLLESNFSLRADNFHIGYSLDLSVNVDSVLVIVFKGINRHLRNVEEVDAHLALVAVLEAELKVGELLSDPLFCVIFPPFVQEIVMDHVDLFALDNFYRAQTWTINRKDRVAPSLQNLFLTLVAQTRFD